jgi:hypothetical protein
VTVNATDTGWKKKRIGTDKIKLIIKNGLGPYLEEFSEKYVLLMKTNNASSVN